MGLCRINWSTYWSSIHVHPDDGNAITVYGPDTYFDVVY